MDQEKKTEKLRILASILFIYLFWIALGPILMALAGRLPLPQPFHSYLIVNSSFWAMALAIVLVSHFILKQKPKELIRKGGIKKPLFFLAFTSYFLIVSLFTLLRARLHPTLYQALHPSLSSLLVMVLVALLATTIQCFSEEFLMRIIPSRLFSNHFASSLFCMLLFVLPHLANKEVRQGDSAIAVISYYALFGFLATLVSLKLGGFEYSLGIHLANNLFIALICNYELSSLPSVSLFLSRETVGTFLDVFQLGMALVLSFLLCLGFAKRD